MRPPTPPVLLIVAPQVHEHQHIRVASSRQPRHLLHMHPQVVPPRRCLHKGHNKTR